MAEDTQELYNQREKRVNDVIALRVPDRVPIMVMFSFFPARYAPALSWALCWKPLTVNS